MRTLLLFTSCFLVVLAGCGSSNAEQSNSKSNRHTTPPSAPFTQPTDHLQTQVETRPQVDRLEFVEGRTITPMMVEVDSSVKMKVIASGAEEVDIFMTENGQETPTRIAKLPTPIPSLKSEKQTYEYEWVPPDENYGGYFWAVARNGTDKSESAQMHVKILK